jgi:predicted TIM-barrel fold metal-dependent hydrolase
MKDYESWKISDCHVHFGQCEFVESLSLSEEEILNYADKYGLKKLLVFPYAVDLKERNRELVDLASDDSRIFGLVRFQAFSYERIEDFLALLGYSKKIVGVKLHPSADRIPITHVAFDSLFKALNDLKAICLVHCGRWKEVSDYSFVFNRAKEFPDIKFIIAHMGGNEIANSRGAILQALTSPNVFLDTSNCRLSILIKEAVDRIGAEKILFGTDYNWGSFMANFYTVLEAPISDDQKKLIFHENLNRLLSR